MNLSAPAIIAKYYPIHRGP